MRKNRLKKNRLQKRPLPINLLNALQRFEAFFFPQLCIICDNPRQENNRWLCSPCLNTITSDMTTRNSCPRCSQNRDLRNCTCDLCWDYPFERIISFTDYTEKIQSIMHQIKYQGKRHLAYYMGQLCALHGTSSFLNECDMVVPIPLHWLRKQKRGYNQAEWFARGLLSGSNRQSLLAGNVVYRARRTATQTKLDRANRRKNIADAFKLTSHGRSAVKGKSIILVDDVVTTGATTASAASVLLNEGCKKVTVVSFTRD